VTGFRAIWEAVIQEFFERSSPGGLRFSINDGGARPDTVTLRLMQSARLMETEA
jgi:malonate decarboxylase delta subunit